MYVLKKERMCSGSKRLRLQKKFFHILLGMGTLLIFNSLNSAKTLPETKPQDVGMSPARLSCLNFIIQDAIQNRNFPGTVVSVARKGKIVFHRAYGKSQWIPVPQPMEKSMIFDLASLTKPIATATSIMILNKGKYKGTRVLSPLTVERMTSIYPRASFSGRGLGWDLDSPYATAGGDIFGPQPFGHTGYTGTSLWIDPKTETVVILLTNRVHPHDEGPIVSLRSKVANVVAGAILEKGT